MVDEIRRFLTECDDFRRNSKMFVEKASLFVEHNRKSSIFVENRRFSSKFYDFHRKSSICHYVVHFEMFA